LSLSDREIVTRQIREAVDIVDLVGSYVSLKRAGASFKGLCPFHEEKTASFIVHPAKQYFKCFGCGAGGDVFTFVQLKENVDFAEARRLLADRAGVSLEMHDSVPQGQTSKRDLVRVNQWAAEVFRRYYEGPEGEGARQYVAGRGISPESARDFGLGLSADSFDALIRQAATANIDVKLLMAAGLIKQSPRGSYYDTFRHRLMFPITDVTGRIVGFGGRALGDDPAKYLNTPATLLFDKSTNLFGLDRARQTIAERGRVVVVEGYTDCMMAHQFGFAETVATLGTAMTEAHARLLRRYTDRTILLFDSDEAGQRAADRALAVSITGGLDVALARVPEGKDPCDYLLSAGKSSFELLLKQAVGALEFKWWQVEREFEGSSTGPGRRRAIEAYLQQLAEWIRHGAIDEIQKGLLVNQVGKILSLPAEDVHRQLYGMTKRAMGRASSWTRRVDVACGGGETQRAGKQRTNSEQEALRQVVEVLLNEPSYYEAVAQHFEPLAIRDRALALVAAELIEVLKSNKTIRIDEFVGRFESPAFGQLITDLQIQGERRGGYDAVIEGAIPCLEACRESRKATLLAEEIRNNRQQVRSDSEETTSGSVNEEKLDQSEPEDEDAQLLKLAASAKYPHFATTKARKRFFEL